MKIVYCIIDSSQAGGMERSICCKANYLADVVGYDVTIITTDRGVEPNFFEFSPNIRFIDLGINYKELDNLSISDRLAKHSRKRKKHRAVLTLVLYELQADIVISTCTHEVSFLFKINDGSKKIAESHLAKDFKKVETKLKKRSFLFRCFTSVTDYYRKQSLKYYDAFVVLTESENREWGVINKKIVTIPNPLSFFPETMTDYTPKRVISVGRLSAEKGFSYLVDAWKLVNLKHPDWQLVIFGNGEERDNLQKQITDLNLEDSIKLYPAVKNISEEYLKSSIYVMPSISEAFGLVLPEAMSCGLPCVAFDDSRGLSEIIKNGEDGFLVETRRIDKLAEKIILLIEDDKLRKEMGQNARQNVERFLPNNIMPQWLSLFNQVIEK